MKAIENGREWIDDHVDKKGVRLKEIARGLPVLMKKNCPRRERVGEPLAHSDVRIKRAHVLFLPGQNHIAFGFLRGTSCQTPPICWRERERVFGMWRCRGRKS
jgi:hypothetical protein